MIYAESLFYGFKTVLIWGQNTQDLIFSVKNHTTWHLYQDEDKSPVI